VCGTSTSPYSSNTLLVCGNNMCLVPPRKCDGMKMQLTFAMCCWGFVFHAHDAALVNRGAMMLLPAAGNRGTLAGAMELCNCYCMRAGSSS
jgi:hypothetical protein